MFPLGSVGDVGVCARLSQTSQMQAFVIILVCGFVNVQLFMGLADVTLRLLTAFLWGYWPVLARCSVCPESGGGSSFMKSVTTNVFDLGEPSELPLRATPSGIHLRPSVAGSGALMASVFLDSAVPIAVESVSGLLLQVNAAFEQLSGVRAALLEGGSLPALLSLNARERLRWVREECLAGRDQSGVEIELVDSMSVSRTLLLTGSLLTDVDGEALAISYQFQDVGALHAQLDELRAKVRVLETQSATERALLERAREAAGRAGSKAQRLESWLLAQQRVSLVLSDAARGEEVVLRVLAVLCPVAGFKSGEFWRVEAGHEGPEAVRNTVWTQAAAGQESQTEGGAHGPNRLALHELLKVGEVAGVGRVFLIEVKTRAHVWGVLRFSGMKHDLDSSLGRALAQVGLQLAQHLAADLRQHRFGAGRLE